MGCASLFGQIIDVQDDPQFEAKSFALELSGQLLPPINLTRQIDRDLSLIRTHFPVVANISGFPNWAPGEVILKLTPAADAAFQNGEFTGFHSLFAALGLPKLEAISLPYTWRVSFGEFYHPVRLAEIIRSIDGVAYADPNYFIIPSTDIEARDDRTYRFSRDPLASIVSGLPSGVYEFSLTERAITLWSQPGSNDPVVVEIPEPSSLLLAIGAIACGCVRRSRCNATPQNRPVGNE